MANNIAPNMDDFTTDPNQMQLFSFEPTDTTSEHDPIDRTPWEKAVETARAAMALAGSEPRLMPTAHAIAHEMMRMHETGNRHLWEQVKARLNLDFTNNLMPVLARILIELYPECAGVCPINDCLTGRAYLWLRNHE